MPVYQKRIKGISEAEREKEKTALVGQFLYKKQKAEGFCSNVTDILFIHEKLCSHNHSVILLTHVCVAAEYNSLNNLCDFSFYIK